MSSSAPKAEANYRRPHTLTLSAEAWRALVVLAEAEQLSVSRLIERLALAAERRTNGKPPPG